MTVVGQAAGPAPDRLVRQRRYLQCTNQSRPGGRQQTGPSAPQICESNVFI
jgi:hypothetical protein